MDPFRCFGETDENNETLSSLFRPLVFTSFTDLKRSTNSYLKEIPIDTNFLSNNSSKSLGVL